MSVTRLPGRLSRSPGKTELPTTESTENTEKGGKQGRVWDRTADGGEVRDRVRDPSVNVGLAR